MNNVMKDYELQIGEPSFTGMHQQFGIYQDGTTPMYRDTDGKLWAMSGHSHCGHVGMFCGTCVADLKEVYPIKQNFCTGHADFAFDGVRYPEGVKARGSIWPFGLYICPNTHRFYCFFHNEAGWRAHGTEYDAWGPLYNLDPPKFDSDFRHIGMMHSDDEGKTWTFDRWVLSGDNVCFTEKYNPGAGNVIGQKEGIISLGSGDFSFYIDHKEGFFYIFYNVIRVNMIKGGWDGCDVYVARSRLRDDGAFGDFVKYYNGAFCEAGNFGRETPIVKNAWHARVVYSEPLGCYIMSSVAVDPTKGKNGKLVDDVMRVQTSDNLVEWSESIPVMQNGEAWGNHYVAMANADDKSLPYVLTSNEFSILTNHNGTNVMNYPVKLIKK
jgi:hypothetical protein